MPEGAAECIYIYINIYQAKHVCACVITNIYHLRHSEKLPKPKEKLLNSIYSVVVDFDCEF